MLKVLLYYAITLAMYAVAYACISYQHDLEAKLSLGVNTSHPATTLLSAIPGKYQPFCSYATKQRYTRSDFMKTFDQRTRLL